ncbi:centromere protein C [Trifolium repens]|nr:centromere protein C [Trifolium repens]
MIFQSSGLLGKGSDVLFFLLQQKWRSSKFLLDKHQRYFRRKPGLNFNFNQAKEKQQKACCKKHQLSQATPGKLCDQKESKGKRLQQRKSIADAGTSWESGVRRSTRFTTKPLECWKGERTVYGRVHESLSTVIGVKCMCPGSDGKPKMKAKSFVSVQYWN